MPAKKKLVSLAESEIFDWRAHFSITRSSSRQASQRTRRWEVQILKTKFSVSFRRFRTKRDNRSKQHNQLVIPLYFLAFKEVALTGQKRYRTKKSWLQKAVYRTRYLSNLNLARLSLIIIGVLGCSLFGPNVYSAVRLNLQNGSAGDISTSTSVKPTATPSMSSSPPVEIQIPSIQVDALVYPVGLQPNGTLIPPSDYTTTGWYNSSPTPGSIGPSIIVGHVDHVGGIGVFWDLRLLQPGDEIDVIRADGTTAKFKVDALREYPQSDFPTQLVYGNVSYAGIRLITCGGVFSEQTHHYSNNIVVFGSLI